MNVRLVLTIYTIIISNIIPVKIDIDIFFNKDNEVNKMPKWEGLPVFIWNIDKMASAKKDND